MTRGEPVPLRDALTAVTNELEIPAPDTLEALDNRWPDIVGATLAQHARVRSVRSGVCTIEVDAPAWATQLRYLEHELIGRLGTHLGPAAVTQIRVVVQGPSKAL